MPCRSELMSEASLRNFLQAGRRAATSSTSSVGQLHLDSRQLVCQCSICLTHYYEGIPESPVLGAFSLHRICNRSNKFRQPCFLLN